MASDKNQKVEGIPTRRSTQRLRGAAFGGAGAICGAALGSMAGPPGAIAGALIGGAMGALASFSFEAKESERAERDERLDRDLGISEGDIGAPNLDHPPAKTGAFSAAASGADTSGGTTPAGGPMSPAG